MTDRNEASDDRVAVLVDRGTRIVRLLTWTAMFVLVCLMLWLVSGMVAKAEDPKAAARAIGNAGNAAARAVARDSSNAAEVPGYAGTNLPERNIGAGRLQDEGRARLADPDDPGGVAGRAVVRGVTNRPAASVPASDPMVRRSETVAASPQSAAHGADGLASGSATGCGADLDDADDGGSCGSVRYCVGAGCETVSPQSNTGFVNATTRLNMAVELGGEEFDRDDMRFFKGQRRRCHIKYFGLANCCKNSGLLVGLANCSASEIELAEERNAGNTHYLGRYCSRRTFFGLCIRHSRAWCVFGSKLGRNSQNLNSCETAQALVGALWSKNDRASSAICAAIGTGQGIFSDYAAAKHGCGADGRRNSTLASASGAMADQVPVNVNYAWKAIRASSFLAGDTQLAEFAMAVTGTLIVTAPTSDSDTSGPRVRILEPLALDRRVTEVLMEGGGALPVYRCDTPNLCLNPTLGTVPIPADRGFRARVAELLRDLVDAVRTDTAPPAPALGLVNLTTLPVYRVANTAAAYRGAVIDQEMDALAEAVALDVMQVWITDLHRTVEERAGTLDIADGEQLQRWREGLRSNRVALARHRHQGLQRLNTALAVVEKLRLIETELAGALSADLRAALAFARGGAGAGSR